MRAIIFLACILPVCSLKMVQKEENIYSYVDMSCKMTVDTKNKKMFLKSDTGNFVVSDGKVHDEDGKVIGSSTPKPMICESDTGRANNSHAFIIVGSSASYLWHYLNPFFNKHCYAKANGMAYYLWFGDATPDMIQAYKTKSPEAAKCSAGLGPHTHYYYPIGMKMILEAKRNVQWLVSMDLSDAWINGAHQHDDALRSILTEKEGYKLSDVAFAAQLGSSRTFCNGALWAVKNTEWSRQWLEKVYTNRCSDMNQLSYWHTTLREFKKENPSFKYNENAMGSYNSARSHMPHAVQQMLSPEQQIVFKKYRGDSNMALHEPLYFGKHFMLLPNDAPEGTSFEDRKKWFGFRGNRAGGEPVLCHRPMDHAMFQQKMGADEQNDHYEEFGNSNNCLRHKTMCTGGGQCMCDA
eukprot:gnl/MRDRNA2_/MRDRNA2_86135_c0_seq2.p1 gnl/MRDRNA2_/MRDRNA2_86135_c0~~gnl/MRDRNA2_/MRDRNA2_86135_c0_seq2.p1  ORF type:complete len:409 (+),score=84.45 gnl/MRDRNA2_/MRDRNA2_86135_c0_seq2:96-1322(+)